MHTQSRIVRRLAFAFTVVVALAAASWAQQAQTESPMRLASGSCIYGGDGKMIYSPRGATCPEIEQPPASAAPAPQRTLAAAPNDDVRAEAAELLAERERLDVELARVRDAVGYADREDAQREVDQALRKIAGHLEREARFLQELGAAPASQQ